MCNQLIFCFILILGIYFEITIPFERQVYQKDNLLINLHAIFLIDLHVGLLINLHVIPNVLMGLGLEHGNFHMACISTW